MQDAYHLRLAELAALNDLLPKHARMLGIDPGTKTLGLALSDVTRTIATPLETIFRTKWKQDSEKLLAILYKQEVAAIVIGMPLHTHGEEGARAQSAKQLAANLRKIIQLPIVFWDERLSTSAVLRATQESGLSRKRTGEVVDKMAASYILQGALDYLKGL